MIRADHGPLLDLGSSFSSSFTGDELFERPIEGLIELAIDHSQRTKTKLRELDLRLADDFITIAYEAKPRPLGLALGVLAIGVAGLALLVRKVRRWRKRRPAPLAKATLVQR